ncbi:MAG: AAA family ATPase [Proteobacteria bacterium]|nr:AAA family ATPase [Pseudomonadota bacterium]
MAGSRSMTSFRDIFYALNRRKWLLLGACLLTLLPTALYLARATPEYTATALVAVRSTPPSTVRAGELRMTIESAAFRGRVVRAQNLDRDPEFTANPVRFIDAPVQWAKMRAADIAALAASIGVDLPHSDEKSVTSVDEALRQRLSASVSADSGLVSIAVRSADRAKAVRLADAIAALCVEEATAADRDEETRVANRLADQVATLAQEASAAAQAVTSARGQPGQANDAKSLAFEIADVSSQLSQARAQTLDRQSRLSALKRAQTNADARGGATDIIANPIIGALRVQEVDAGRRLLEASQKYGENHPRVVQAREELGQVRGAIASEVRKIQGALESEAAAFEGREKQLEQKLAELKEQAQTADERDADLRKLEKVAEDKAGAHKALLQQVNERAAVQKERGPSVRLFAPAAAPETPSSPRYVEAASLALAFGLVVGLLGCWGLEYFDAGFRTGAHIEQLTGRSLLGMVPALPRAVLRRSAPVQYATAKHMSAYAESLRSIRTSIALGAEGLEHKVVMITSSLPEEGKSTFSCSLAQVVARSNPDKKVIIVDCDLRRPAVLKLLRMPEPRGTIDEYLSGMKSLTDILHRDDTSGLYYIPAKFGTKRSMELLGSAKMQSLVNALSAEFDLVLLDTPPVMAVADPRVVASLASYVVFLIRWGKTDRNFATTALKLLAAVPHVGVVLSQVDLRRHSRYGYADHGAYYSKYGSYYLES